MPALPCRFAVRSIPKQIDEDHDDDTCNSGDVLVRSMRHPDSKLVWHVRHGQSSGNVARDRGLDYMQDRNYIDTPLSEKGLRQAQGAAKLVKGWGEKPTLIISSAMTRSIQTAAIMFGELLESGAAELVIRPEVREFWPDNIENCGRTLPELLRCPVLQQLDCWAVVAAALSEEATVDWAEDWDDGQAGGAGGAWEKHCGGGERIEQFRQWFAGRDETRVAVVSHWGAINNILNREPWVDSRSKFPGFQDFPESWPADGLAQMFSMSNCGWVAVEYAPN